MQLLKKNPAYMAEHGHDYKERFAPSEMRHLRNWWKEQKKADGKLRQKAGTGGSGGKPLEKLSHFQTLRRDCFQSNDACNRRDLMKETFNLSAAGGSASAGARSSAASGTVDLTGAGAGGRADVDTRGGAGKRKKPTKGKSKKASKSPGEGDGSGGRGKDKVAASGGGKGKGKKTRGGKGKGRNSESGDDEPENDDDPTQGPGDNWCPTDSEEESSHVRSQGGGGAGDLSGDDVVEVQDKVEEVPAKKKRRYTPFDPKELMDHSEARTAKRSADNRETLLEGMRMIFNQQQQGAGVAGGAGGAGSGSGASTGVSADPTQQGNVETRRLTLEENTLKTTTLRTAWRDAEEACEKGRCEPEDAQAAYAAYSEAVRQMG
ncbi:unnamed protein product [Pylaiella littoralis]